MKRRFVVAAGSAAMGTALVLSGCSGTGTESGTTGAVRLSANQALLQSSQKTGQADSFKAELTISDAEGGGKVRANGQFRLRPELTFNARLDEFSHGGQSMPGLKGQAIYTGDALYAKVPQLARFVADGKPWLKVDVNQAARQTGIDVRELVGQVQKINPAEQTKMFTGSKDARRVGEETVDGVRTTHYTGTVTVQDALSRLDPQIREKVRERYPRGASDEKIAFDLWVDGDQLPRKLVSKDAAGRTGGTVTVVYSDYGRSFSVNPPPADEVGEFSLDALVNGRPRN
ncbi:hypothetical protein ACFQ07_32180 [Actinomadura adrarensis]|uniref:LppX_LprAFG lipoprotein n=1 Tax=Actinomadura adrarensis TaxID=1819600 RepID=A0ABW3CQW3_9ACTN